MKFKMILFIAMIFSLSSCSDDCTCADSGNWKDTNGSTYSSQSDCETNSASPGSCYREDDCDCD